MINWIVRYAKILNENRELFDDQYSVLEVGSGSQGIAQYLKRKVVGLEPVFAGTVNEWLEPAEGSILAIPFADASFDYVICVDVLEHIPPLDRPRAIAELARCTRRKLIISCPCGASAQIGDAHLLAFFKKYFLPSPPWLTQNLWDGMPAVVSILTELFKTGEKFEISVNETVTQHYAGIILDHVFPLAEELKNLLLSKTSLMSPLAGAQWDEVYSYVFTLFAGSKNRPVRRLDYGGGSASGGTAEIYSIYHKPWPADHLGRVRPIFVGHAAGTAQAGDLTDILADGTRLANGRWSELSAMYKIWKEGPRSDIVGFCHYRRLFNFSEISSEQPQVFISQEQLSGHSNAFYDEAKLAALGGHAIMCASPLIYTRPIWETFIKSHNAQDYCRLVSIIAARFPALMPFIIEQHVENSFYANNIFAANWIFFDELCSLWFDVLREFESLVPADRGNDYQNRDIGFLSERVFDAWIRYKKSLGVQIIEVPIFFVQ